MFYEDTQYIKVDGDINFFAYVDLVLGLKDSKLDPESRIVFLVESEGGYVSASNRIKDYLKTVECETIAYVDGCAQSAGAELVLSCDKICMDPEAYLMFHLPQYSDRPVSTTHRKDLYDLAVAEDSVRLKRYLTDDEWAEFLAGEDVYIRGEDFNARIGDRFLPFDKIFKIGD